MTFPIPLLQHLSGKAACWVRGTIQHLDSQEPAVDMKLRPSQKAGMDFVEELGETISIPYISKLTKHLEDAGVVDKYRKGKGYVLNKGPKFDLLAEWLMENYDWGTSIQKEASEDDILRRSAFLDHMLETGSCRIQTEAPLPKILYQLAIDKFKAGDYDMVFVRREVELQTIEDDDLGYPVETFTASVSK